MDTKKFSLNRIIASLYGFVFITFCILEPWGNVDTRDFSYLSFQKFWEYNAYIGFVLIGIIVLGILLWKNKVNIKTILWMTVINTMFLVMTLFDVLHFFPETGEPLPVMVALIEIVDSFIILGILLYTSKLLK